jgi:hypothetical protein
MADAGRAVALPARYRHGDEETWADLASGKITGSSAAAAGGLVTTGNPQATARLRKILSRRRVLAEAEATIQGVRDRG